MHTRLVPLLTTALLLSACGAAVTPASPSGTAAPSGVASSGTVRAEFISANADTAIQSFISSYYDPSLKYFYENSDHQVQSHKPGPQGGLYTDYWWEAQLWETVMDAYQRTNSSTYRQMIDDVFDGFFAQYPNWSDNPFNDDINWWALAAVRAYTITGETRFLDRAKAMFDFIYSQSYTSDYGGGIWWNRNNFLPQKNVATNASAAITAILLSRALNDSSYLTKGQNLFSWVRSRLYDGNGRVYDHVEGSGNGTAVTWEYTYNNGTFLRAAWELYKSTNQASYKTDAVAAADWVVNHMTLDGTLLYEGVDDLPGFKMIFARNLNVLRTEGGQSQYLSFLQRNASQAWNHRRADGLIGPDWTLTPDSSYIQSLAAAAGADMLQFAPADGSTGTVVGSGQYELENADSNGVSNEDTNAGYTGRGYLAGWNTDATWVDVPINVTSAGLYRLTFRYAAAAGNATRQLLLDGSPFTNLTFPGTSSWTTWSTASVVAPLHAGTTVLRVAYNTAAGSANYLNGDRLNVSAASNASTVEAESGTLHSLTVESSNAGYTGSGYVAGWHTDGQWVDVTVNAPSAGRYTLVFRYAAAAGDASRYVIVNGSDVQANQGFPATGAWTTYRTIAIPNVSLNAGNNTVSVIYNSSKGSQNYLNLDSISTGQ